MCIAAAIGGAAIVGAGASIYAGNKQAGAASDAADAQQQSARDSIAYQTQTRDLARSDLSPFVNFATGSIGHNSQPGQVAQTQGNFNADAYLAANPDVAANAYYSKNPYLHYMQHGQNEGRAFIANAGAAPTGGNGYAADSPLGMLSNLYTQQGQTDYLRNNPLFQIGMDKLDRASNNSFLGRGQVGSANNQIVQNAYLAGQPLLQQQTNNLLNAANLGQSSAAGQANTAVSTGAGVANTMEGAGNSQAAGIIGAGNAQAAGYQGIGNAFGSAAGAYAGYNQPLLYQQNNGYGYHSSIPSIYGNQGASNLGYGQVAA